MGTITRIQNPDLKNFDEWTKIFAEIERPEIAKGCVVSSCMPMMTSYMPMMRGASSLRYWRSFMAGKLPPLRHREGGPVTCKKGKYSIGIRGGGGGGGENMFLQPPKTPLSTMYQGPIFQSRFDIFSVKKSAGRKGRCHTRCHL